LCDVPVVGRERTVVAAIPGVVQRITGVSFVAVDFQFVVFCFRVDLEVAVLRIPVGRIIVES
jgi:hypothetical protein